jgi:hypothetical protein
MKRSLAWSIGVAAILFATATWVSAATIYDIARPWTVYAKAKGKVTKLGTDRSEGPGEITFTPGSDPYTGSFAYEDVERHIFTGPVILSPDGKKLTMKLDGPGLAEFEDMMAAWLQRAASWELCLKIETIRFEYDEKGIVMSPVKISKKTNSPTKGTVSAKGIVSADVCNSNVTVSGKFSFKSTIEFIVD